MNARNYLSQVEFFKLCKHLEGLQSKSLLTNKAYAATCISQDIGFQVTQSNIEAAMSATGIEAEKAPKSFKAKAKHNGKAGSSGHNIRTVARSLLSLCADLGHTPRNLQALAKVEEYEIEDEQA